MVLGFLVYPVSEHNTILYRCLDTCSRKSSVNAASIVIINIELACRECEIPSQATECHDIDKPCLHPTGCTLMNVTGMLTDCSIDCCQDRLCNMPGAQESITKPNNPPKARNRAVELTENFCTRLLVLVLAMYSMCLA